MYKGKEVQLPKDLQMEGIDENKESTKQLNCNVGAFAWRVVQLYDVARDLQGVLTERLGPVHSSVAGGGGLTMPTPAEDF